MKKKMSITDIAKAMKISKTAVSFVLNGKARTYGISDALEKRILNFIDTVGYRPNRMAQGLRTGKSNTIGMMIEDISDPFFSSLAREVEEIASAKGYRIIYGSTENNTSKTLDLIDVFRHHQVDGYIVAPAPAIETGIENLLIDGYPVVIFDRPLENVLTPLVLIDNYESSYSAITHLVDNGFKHIAMVTLKSVQRQMADRLRAYRAAVAQNGFAEIVLEATYHENKEDSVCRIKSFFLEHKEIDAVFFATNYIAFNGMEAIKKIGLQIGYDIGVVVFDDHNSFELLTPSITAVAQPISKIAEAVMAKIIGQLTRKDNSFGDVTILKTSLIARESSMQNFGRPYHKKTMPGKAD
jgi:LacI family transcriptional regulator